MQPLAGQIYSDFAQMCPDDPAKILSVCGDNVPCLYDYTMINAEILGTEAKNAYNAFAVDRMQAIRQCKLYWLQLVKEVDKQSMRNAVFFLL